MSTTRNDGGQAYPSIEYFDEKPVGNIEGLTKRDFFAAAALPALITETSRQIYEGQIEKKSDAEVESAMSEAAYRIADAMLEARKK